MTQPGPRGARPATPAIRPAEAVLLALVLAAGIAIGAVVPRAFTGGAPAPPPSPALVDTDPHALVTQPSDLPGPYRVQDDSQAPDPGQTRPRLRDSVTIARVDVPGYAAQAAVNVYGSVDEARSAFRTLLALGQFGSELAMHGSLGDEAHLFAARAGDRSLLVGSVLWRDRNTVAYVFVYNPYPPGTADDAVERLARANAYDDTVGLAVPIEQRIRSGRP